MGKHKHRSIANTPREQNDKTASPKQNAAEEARNAYPNRSPAQPEPNPPNARCDKSCHCGYHAKPRWMILASRAFAVFEWLAICGGISYAIVTYYQWKDLRHNFALDQRPWIGVSDAKIEKFSQGDSYIVDIPVNNSGKMPSFRAWYWNKSAINPAAGPQTSNMDDGKKHIYMGSIPPQGQRLMRLTWQWEEWQIGYLSIANRISLLSNYGEIVYYDADGKEHRTQFCIYMKDAGLPTQHPTFCNTWNEMN